MEELAFRLIMLSVLAPLNMLLAVVVADKMGYRESGYIYAFAYLFWPVMAMFMVFNSLKKQS